MTREYDLVHQLRRGEFDDRLDEVVDAVRWRYKQIRSQKMNALIGRIEPEQIYRLTNIKPAYLKGQLAEVVEPMGLKVRVRMLNSIAGRKVKAGMIYTVSLASLEAYTG